MRKGPQMVEAVLFFDEQGICRQMLYTEFEAVLDCVFSLTDYAGQRLRAAFVLIDTRLQARAAVFFTLDFDAQGMADRLWNIPLRQMAEQGEASLDLGGGPIRLACASHCPLPGFGEQLWDPVREPARNDLLLIRDAVARNPFGLLDDEASDTVAFSVPELHMAEEDRWYSAGTLANTAAAEAAADDERNQEQRLKAARLIKQQRTLLNNVTQQCEDLKRDHAKALQQQQLEHQKYCIKLQRDADRQLAKLTKRLDDQQREQARYLIEHARHLEDLGSGNTRQLSDLQRDLRLQVDINNRLLAQLSQQADTLRMLQQQVLERDEQIAKLQERLASQEPSETLVQLAAQGVVFVAFHPGAGHLTIPLGDLRRYQDDPLAYVASKCAVSPTRYRNWLRHYQHAHCEACLDNGQPCGASLERVDSPNRFNMGVSNFCAEHKTALRTAG